MASHFISREDAGSDLLACAAFIAESIPPGEAHASAISSVIPHFLEKGNVDLAAELANSVDDPFTRDRLLIAVASKCAELDDDEYALQLVEAIEDPGRRAQGYEHVGIVKADKGQIEKAGDVAALMIHPDGIHMRVAIRQATDGDDALALATIGQIEFARDAVMALNAIASDKIGSGDFEQAEIMLSSAEKKTAEIEHDVERIRSFCEIGNLLIEADRKSRAVTVFETARTEAEELDNAQRDVMIAQAAIGFLGAGSVELADRALDAASDKTQIATVVLAFARDHWQKEEREEAVDALVETSAILRSQHETETRDSRAKFGLMATVAAQFAGFQQAERSLEEADSIPDPGQKVAALSRIAGICVGLKNEPLAREALALIADRSDRAFALIGMSDAVIETENENSEGLLREAETAVDEIELPGPKVEAMLAIGERHLKAGRNEKLRSNISKALDVLAGMLDDGVRVSGLARLSSISETSGLELTASNTDALLAILGQDKFKDGR